ncbi:UNVERIFIED_CONTAM: hypothetical protein PYX00_000796 [Menopon gallinae]|uniref:guanylate kinase n=1 Tax=Menopon gallinae TaxID=328185 RepID=A0AAW2IBA8_9NEOP
MRLFSILKQLQGIEMVHSGLKALVICGPSGSGKSTLLRRLFDDFPEKFGFSVSHTTRTPRPGEIDGKHYHFTTPEEMQRGILNGEFLETAIYSNNMYGTSKQAVNDVIRQGKICVLDIDVQGVKQVKQTDLNAIYIFLKPPNLETLQKRLRDRGTETEETLERRLRVAREEIEYGDTPNNFDLVLVNDSIEKSYEQLKNFILLEIDKRSGSGKILG